MRTLLIRLGILLGTATATAATTVIGPVTAIAGIGIDSGTTTRSWPLDNRNRPSSVGSDIQVTAPAPDLTMLHRAVAGGLGGSFNDLVHAISALHLGVLTRLTIGDTAPDFSVQTTEGPIRFHEWIEDSWTVLFSHPRDFTPVCTTELGYMAKIKPEFDRRNVKIIGLSVDPLDNHTKWAQDIADTQGAAPNYPLIADTDFAVSKAYGMLPPETTGDPTQRTPAENATLRNVFVIGPDKKIKLVMVYPMTTGRNFDEVLRAIDSLQLTATHRLATPAQWRQGDDVIIAGSVSDDEARQIYPDGWQSPRPYLRIVPSP